jgi:hypothetical protein
MRASLEVADVFRRHGVAYRQAHDGLSTAAAGTSDDVVAATLGVSGSTMYRTLLDAPGRPFYDPEADDALFEALEKAVRQAARRGFERVDANINDDTFVGAVVGASLTPSPRRERRARCLGSNARPSSPNCRR